MRNTPTAQDSIVEAFLRHEKKMYTMAFAVLNDPFLAEDAVMDALERLLKRGKPMPDPESPDTKRLLVCVVKSASIDIYRKNQRRWQREVPLDADAGAAERIADPRAVTDQIEEQPELLQGLPEAYRIVLYEHYYKERTVQEIAEELNLTESAVKKRLSRGLAMIRERRKGGLLYDKEGYKARG